MADSTVTIVGNLTRDPEIRYTAGAASATLVAGDLGRGPTQARADLVGHDLHHAALLAVLRLPAALLEAAGDDHPRALAQ